MKPTSQFLSSQERLVETFLASAGKEYIGKTFILGWQGKDKTKHFSCNNIGFSLNISDSELFSLAQHGYLQIHTDPPAIIFTEKTLEKTTSETNLIPPSEGKISESDSRILKAYIFEFYAWLALSLVASVVSLYLLTTAIQQVLDNNVTPGIVSALFTAVSGFVTTMFFKRSDKANKQLKSFRTKLSTKKGIQK